MHIMHKKTQNVLFSILNRKIPLLVSFIQSVLRGQLFFIQFSLHWIIYYSVVLLHTHRIGDDQIIGKLVNQKKDEDENRTKHVTVSDEVCLLFQAKQSLWNFLALHQTRVCNTHVSTAFNSKPDWLLRYQCYNL